MKRSISHATFGEAASAGDDTPSPLDFELYINFACKKFNITDSEVCLEFHRLNTVSSNLNSLSARKAKSKQKEQSTKNSCMVLSTSDNSIFISDKPTIDIWTYYDSQNHLIQLKFKGHMLMPRKVLQIISLIIPFHPHVYSLSFQGSIVASFTICEIRTMQLKLNNLTDICLDSSFIPEANFDLLLGDPTKIKFLSLARCCINDDVVQRIFAKISREPASKTLNTLNLASNRITDAGLQCIADVLRSNRQLYYLNISANQITDDGVKLILDVLKSFVLKPPDLYMKRKEHIEFLIEQDAQRQAMKIDKTKKDVKKYARGLAKTARIEVEEEEEFEHVFSGKNITTIGERSYCMGNNALCVLNIAYNNLSMMTLRGVLRVMEEQRRCDRRPRGLLRVNIEGNYLPETCDELDQLQEMLDEQIKVTLPRKPGATVTSTPRRK